MRTGMSAPRVWVGVRVASWIVGLLVCIAPLSAQPQAVSLPLPPIGNVGGDTLAGSSTQVGRWVLDIGGCPQLPVPCITKIPASIDFTGTPDTTAQVDASEGILHPASHTPGYWDLSQYTGITFNFEDLNAAASKGLSPYSHYFLIYDDNHCYRAWYLNYVNPDGSQRAGAPSISPNVWYQVSGSFSTPQSTYVTQAGTPVNGVACNSVPLNYKAIGYFEVGIFGGPLRQGDGILYHWRVGGVTPFNAPP